MLHEANLSFYDSIKILEKSEIGDGILMTKYQVIYFLLVALKFVCLFNKVFKNSLHLKH